MIRSMTGFGAAESLYEGYAVAAEIRSVNHRFAELVVKLPREWSVWEEGIRRAVQPFVRRGRVDVTVQVERQASAGRQVVVDWTLVDSYREAAEMIRSRLGLPESERLTLAQLLQLPDLLTVSESQDPERQSGLEAAMLSAVREAASRLAAARAAEGAALLKDLDSRLTELDRLSREVGVIAPSVAGDYRAKLSQKLGELLADGKLGAMPDENRLAMEVALLAERSDIQEELTRLNSHLFQCRELLQADEPIGRKLDFFIQEMNREINTMGSKANRVDIVGRVVDMKAELEKLREQVQNIE